METPSAQRLSEFRVMRNVISGGTPEFLTHQDRVAMAYREQNKKAVTNFPFKF